MDYKKTISQLRLRVHCPVNDPALNAEAAHEIETLLAERDAAVKILRGAEWCTG